MPRPPGDKPPRLPTEAARREQRRADALRANLRRRKGAPDAAGRDPKDADKPGPVDD